MGKYLQMGKRSLKELKDDSTICEDAERHKRSIEKDTEGRW